ncbi:hypothetical protein Psuf_051140 [Phytohabitans suffuscus]|uniref:Membrane transport protein MMPL domain-containing protein n=1 Tax=Phytohabitans suffuscus TaxID=624315 RepID=A0A6F8YP94_9ACTN|nr:hypothetical protein [Phytohabitans suffuscus]BCB87801.1 hypothetical protein Psuf_051140 [Phytohabitans suffuscus]
MFERLGRFVVYNPWKVILAWLVAAVGIVVFAPTLSDVTTGDQANFLPNSYESVQAQELAEEKFSQANDSTATVVVRRTDGQPLTEADQAKVGEMGQAVQSADIEKVTGVVTGPEALSPTSRSS